MKKLEFESHFPSRNCSIATRECDKDQIFLQIKLTQIEYTFRVEMSCLNGGWPADAMNYVNTSGLASDTNYEFLSYMNECSNTRIKRAVKITDFCEREMKKM